MKITPDFYLTEFVPKEIHDTFKDKSIWFIDPKIPIICQKLRDIIGKPITINNWHDGGTYNYSGFRTRSCNVGAENSQHRHGRAADLHIAGITPEEVRQLIRDNFSELNKLGLTTIEKNTDTWTHVDVRCTNMNTLLEVPFQ